MNVWNEYINIYLASRGFRACTKTNCSATLTICFVPKTWTLGKIRTALMSL